MLLDGYIREASRGSVKEKRDGREAGHVCNKLARGGRIAELIGYPGKESKAKQIATKQRDVVEIHDRQFLFSQQVIKIDRRK